MLRRGAVRQLRGKHATATIAHSIEGPKLSRIPRVYPYAFGSQFAFGVEIELESEPSDPFVENVTDSDIIAGWDKDASLERTALRLLKRAGRPEPSERYARIAATRGNA